VSIDRQRLGSWYTPAALVADVVTAALDPDWLAGRERRPLRVLDPACGDGRFLAAVAERAGGLGAPVELHGVDLDPLAVAAARDELPGATIELDDALARDWPPAAFDLVIGNPPFLSQMAAATSRGRASRHGGGPYADAAAEFLALASELADPDHGRVAFVLPQSLLASRDAAPIRDALGDRAALCWSRWTAEREFDAHVYTCAVVVELAAGTIAAGDWTGIVGDRLGIPSLPSVSTAGHLGDRATLNANFRDEYYGLLPAVGDHDAGPPLITSGLIDPGVSRWGRRAVTVGRRRWHRPRIDTVLLDASMRRWAQRRLVPKVLVANQTSIIEAVADPLGEWLPGVPVVCAYPVGAHWDDDPPRSVADLEAAVWEIAAVLTSGFASVWAWHRCAGTGLSASAIRLSPTVLADLPWPAGDLSAAVEHLRARDVRACAAAVDRSGYAMPGTGVTGWWTERLERIEARRPPIE
jgi:SAM-dependent methyltransferase